MKQLLFSFLFSLLAFTATGQTLHTITTLQQRALEAQVTGDNYTQTLKDLPILSRGIISENNTSSVSLPATGQGLLMQDINWTYGTTFSFTTPTAARTITVPDASGTLLLTGSSGQAITDPVITGGLTASGSVANDFSGSTGAFKTSTGQTTIGGSVVYGGAAYNPSGAGTVSLTAAQSGQTFLLDAASGVVYTLPAPVVGLTYNFQVSVSVTSNAHEIRTNTSSVFIEGVIAQIGSTTTFGFLANGSTHQAIKMTGSTLGGLIGSQFTLTCVSATEWMISGVNVGSGTAATPFTATP